MEVVDVRLGRRLRCRFEPVVDRATRADLGPFDVARVADALSAQLGEEVELRDAESSERPLLHLAVVDQEHGVGSRGPQAAHHPRRLGRGLAVPLLLLGPVGARHLPSPLPTRHELVDHDQRHRPDRAADERVVGPDDGVLHDVREQEHHDEVRRRQLGSVALGESHQDVDQRVHRHGAEHLVPDRDLRLDDVVERAGDQVHGASSSRAVLSGVRAGCEASRCLPPPARCVRPATDAGTGRGRRCRTGRARTRRRARGSRSATPR